MKLMKGLGLVVLGAVVLACSGVDPSGLISNPTPTVASLAPASASPGGPAFTLTVNGSGFVATSEVRWNGAARVTTYVNAGQLKAAIPAADIANAGAANITVFNPSPDGGTSNTLAFQIQTAALSVTMAGSAFAPKTIQAKAGQTITWTNNDVTTHTVTADAAGGPDSGGAHPFGMSVNATYSWTVPAAAPVGTHYYYHCGFHGFSGGGGGMGTGMAGAVQVIP